MAMDDLFGKPLLPGLAAADRIVNEAEAASLTAQIDAAALSPFRFQQWTGKRLTRSFGWSYDFESAKFAPADPIPDWLSALRARAARFADLDAADFAHVLLTRYDPGAGIGWHKDRPVFEHVVGVSLGAPATMHFRRRSGAQFERVSLSLEPRSIYHLTGEARHGWEHSIASLTETRWSITFRSLAERR